MRHCRCYLRDGYQQLPPEWRPEVRFPLILGTDLSGVVVARADDVREVAVGDEVYAMARFPEGAAGGSRAYAEYVSVPVSDLARKPLTLSHQQAAAVPMSLLTAWQFMIDPGHEVANPLQPGPHRPAPLAGKRVLVNGAAGGVGPGLSARFCRGGRGATARSDGLDHPGALQRRAARPACRPAGRRSHPGGD